MGFSPGQSRDHLSFHTLANRRHFANFIFLSFSHGLRCLLTQGGREGYKVSSHLLVWAATGQAVTAGKCHLFATYFRTLLLVCQSAQLELGITCIHIQQMLLPAIIRSGIRSQVVLQVPHRLLLLILLLRPCCYILNGFPVSSVPTHSSVVWPGDIPAGASLPGLGAHQALNSSCYYLCQLPPRSWLLGSLQTLIRTAEQIKDLFRKWCFINT